MRKLMLIVGMVFVATPAFAGSSKIAHQEPGTYTPRPEIAAELLNYLAGQLPFGLGYVASGITGHATAMYGVSAPYRELPKAAIPGKVSGVWSH